MKNNHLDDRAVLKLLLEGGRSEDKAFEFLYSRYHGMISELVIKMGGTPELAEDVFQDSLITLYEQVKDGKFELKAKISTYLYTIARNRWLNVSRKNKRILSLDSASQVKEEDASTLDLLYTKERGLFAKTVLTLIDPDCIKILNLAIYENKPMSTIARLMEFKNEQVARNKKYKCLEKLKNRIKKSLDLSSLANELQDE